MYTLDNVGNRKTRTDKRTNVTLTYGYDNIYQLQTAKQGTTTKESYTYDLVGNRLSSLGVSPYNYNTSNELTSTPSGSYTYDNNGNRKTDPSGAQYSWDYENRLTQEILPGTGGTVTFKYDPFGRRAQKAFTHNGVTTTTNYLYDGANVLESVDQNGSLLARYVDSLGVDEPLQEVVSGTTSYYEQDGIGSVSSLSNSAAALANTYTYDSYGKLAASTGTIVNPFRFTGREYDSETGEYFYRARYYDQGVGRFINEDPLRGISGSVNFYLYVNNSPVRLFDPSGMCPCDYASRFRLVPTSDCSHPGYREIVYELQGQGASNYWVTEHQNPAYSAPAANGSPEGQSTGNENDGPGGFDDTLFGWRIGNSLQNFTISPQDPRKVPDTPSCPVDVQLPSGPNGKPQDYRTLGLWHGGFTGYQYINGNSTGWVPCNPTYDQH